MELRMVLRASQRMSWFWMARLGGARGWWWSHLPSLLGSGARGGAPSHVAFAGPRGQWGRESNRAVSLGSLIKVTDGDPGEEAKAGQEGWGVRKGARSISNRHRGGPGGPRSRGRPVPPRASTARSELLICGHGRLPEGQLED